MPKRNFADVFIGANPLGKSTAQPGGLGLYHRYIYMLVSTELVAGKIKQAELYREISVAWSSQPRFTITKFVQCTDKRIS